MRARSLIPTIAIRRRGPRARLLALASLCAWIALGTGLAAAKIETANLEISVSGSQATTWRLQRSSVVAGCTLSLLTDGSQMIRFLTPRPDRVLVTKAYPGSPFYAAWGGRPVIPGPIPLQATVTREMESTADLAIFGRDGCVRTVKGTPVVAPGCGERSGAIGLQMVFSAAPSSAGRAEQGEDEIVPLISPVNHLRLNGIEPRFAGGDLLSALPACPLMDSPAAPEAHGELLDARYTLRESRLFAGRPITLHASAVRPVTGIPGVTGQTIVTYNLQIKRARRR
jgi:hypothetical protein